jgi:hypothetical protein
MTHMEDTTSAEMMAAPVLSDNGHKSFTARRATPKGLLPSTWLQRELRIEHCVGGAVRETVGTLADLYPAGPIQLVDGRRTLISWDTLCVCELRPD